MHDSEIPRDLLELKTRLETWRENRKYIREPIPDELRQAADEMIRCYSPSMGTFLQMGEKSHGFSCNY